MVQNLAKSVNKALKLIQSGKQDAARSILLKVLRQDEKNDLVWFLLSFTIPPGEKQEFALFQALRINPDFNRARERLDKLQNRDNVEVVQLAEPQEQSEFPAIYFEDQIESGRFLIHIQRRWLVKVVLIGIVLVILFLVFSSRGFSNLVGASRPLERF